MNKTKRGQIADALLGALKQISVANGFNTDLYEEVSKRFIFADENPPLPFIAFSVGAESIRYQPGGFQDRYLTVTIRCYVESQDDSIQAAENIIQDVEKVLEENARLVLEDGTMTRDIRITLIDTDQGVLAPLGLAEIQVVVEY